MAASSRTRFIAFYSYKGGVGRTLALANCARALSAGGRRVTVLDLDLEAPGLEHFDTLRPRGERRPHGADRRPPLSGFAEYIAACRSDGPPEHLADYCHRCAGLPDDKGEVWLMPAGRRGSPAYQAVLALDWERFYREENGYRLVENLRGHLVEELKPDYVLLDARTGLTELGGIATHQLADLVVLLFNLNRQNLEGIRWVHDSLLAVPNPPLLLLAASPIPAMPAGKGTPFDERMRYVRDHLKGARNAGRPIVIPYQPVLAWEERILVDSRDDPFDYDAPYRRLLELILKSLDAPEVFLDRAMQEWRDDDVKSALETLDQGVAANPRARQVWRAKLDFLMAEEAKASDPEKRFTLRRQIEEAKARVAALGTDAQAAGRRVNLAKLPAGTQDFLGRGPELEMLDAAWSEGDAGVAVVTLIAPVGVGKTALVKRWLDRLRADGWRGAEAVFGWCFYSQGAENDRQASDDSFLAEALAWFAVDHDPAASPWDKGRLLALAVAARRTLLVLDGCERLQYPPGPLGGQLRTPGLKALLTQLADSGQPGVAILTSREPLADLDEYTRGPMFSQGLVLNCDLGNLSDTDGARLLHRLGCTRAGATAIGPEDAELVAASREVRGHALTLNLLGRYLAQAEGGDCRRRDTVGLMDAADSQGDYAARVLEAYENWLAHEGRGVDLAALRLLGLFDRPADVACLAALRQEPPIPGLTEPLMGLTERPWNRALSGLAECGLIEPPGPAGSGTLDAHPLVREYLGKRLRETQPDAWREGHRRLYEHLKASVPERPDGLDGLLPLYQAIRHGCLAGLQQEALTEVYSDRILRGTGADGFYSLRKLGAFGADLAAVACFFAAPWRRVSDALIEADRAWLLNQAAFSLRALGRLTEALEPMRTGLQMLVQQEDWKNAAISAGNLSELGLTLGLVPDALADAGRAAEYADCSGDAFQRMSKRTTLADALHQKGERGSALGRFREAETMQAERQPQFPLLYALAGYRYCDLLLAGPERAAWRVLLARAAAKAHAGSVATALATETIDWADQGSPTSTPADAGAPLGFVPQPNLRAECDAVAKRAEQTLEQTERAAMDLLSIALDHLTLGRAALFLALLDPAGPTRPALDRAARDITAAVDGLRAAGTTHHIPRALLPRALLHTLLQSPAAARADLDEAEQIASRGGMNLLLADCRLHRARLLRDRAELARARALIEQCGYRRRREELEDAETAAPGWS